MTISVYSSPLRPLSALCIFLCILPVFCLSNLELCTGGEVVLASDGRIQYNPAMNETTVWEPRNVTDQNLNLTLVATSDDQARVSFTFQGTSLQLCALANPLFPTLLITLDSTQFPISNFHTGHSQKPTMVPLSEGRSELDSSVNHTVTIQKGLNESSESEWNILAVSFTPSPTFASESGSTIPLLPTISSDQNPSSQAAAGTSPSGGLSSGAIAGVVLGVLLGISLAGFLFVHLRRRHRQIADAAPDPLVISPAAPRRDRSRFQRIYSDRLPRFTAPSSVWPTSELPTSTLADPPFAITREESHEKGTPFMLPVLTPQILTPSPPKRFEPRRPKYFSFFVANPSSHSSRSVRSQSLTNQRVTTTKVDSVVVEPAPWVDYIDEKVTMEQQDARRIAKGKQRAVDFEIDPVPPPRMTRKQSLRRFFFTTNPNPSTSSASSTSSSRQVKNWKNTAVTEYVRSQMRQKPPAGSRPDSSSLILPLAVPAPPLLHPDSIPEEVIPPPLALPAKRVSPTPNPPTKSRRSQTRFFTTNPSPSVQDLAADRAESESVLSEIPPPRKDKGKGRAS